MKQLQMEFPAERENGGTFPALSELQALGESLLRTHGGKALAARLQVQWNARLRTTAGLAHPARATIWLNPRLEPFGRDEIERTLRHELAHILAQHRAGRRRIAPHGPEWRQACADLGLAGEARCHTLPLPRRAMERRHIYRCPHCRAEIGRVRPIKRRVACYECCRRFSRGRFDDRFRLRKVREAA